MDCVRLFGESLTDYISIIISIIITLTLFRFLYFIAILSVNGHISIFNKCLKRVSQSSLLIIKLQQIERIMNDPTKKQQAKERYLSLKYCIYLSFIEWLLDILVLPFILLYLIIPWRLNLLFGLVVS